MKQLTDFGQRPTFIARRVSWSVDGKFVFVALGEGDADVVLLRAGFREVTVRRVLSRIAKRLPDCP
jgi:hypothetical protein